MLRWVTYHMIGDVGDQKLKNAEKSNLKNELTKQFPH